VSAEAFTIEDFYGAWDLYHTPALTGAIVGLVLGVIGVYVVLRRLVFLAAAVSQAASLGVAGTFFLAVTFADPWWLPSPTVGAIALTFLATLVVAGRRGRSSAWRDAALGMIFLVGAAGTLALGTRIVEELHDIDTLLFGSAVAVLPEDFTLVLWLFGAVLLVHAWAWRGFAAVSFDFAGARVRGLPVGALDGLLFLTIALVISVGTRVVGALPVFALSVLPAVAAARLSTNLPRALFAAAGFGLIAGFYGYLLAFVLDLPVGPAQALVAAALVVLAEGARGLATLPVRLAEGASPLGETPQQLLGGLRGMSWAALGVGAWILAHPLLVGVGQGLGVPGVADPAVLTTLAILAAAGALLGALLAWRALGRPRLALGFSLGACWAIAASLVTAGGGLFRPVLLAAAVFGVAGCFRAAAQTPPPQGAVACQLDDAPARVAPADG